MSTRQSLIYIGNVHIYHEWEDEGFIYAHIDGDPFKLCSLEEWKQIVEYIKDDSRSVASLIGSWEEE